MQERTDLLNAEGNISARFFENAKIISHGDIKCDYMLNTNAMAYGNIYLEGSSALLSVEM